MVTSFTSARPLTSFCAIKKKQIKETRRNPVPKQRCISVPHSGSGRGLSCSRLWNRTQKVCGTVWDAQSSFQWHLIKSHSSWAVITNLYDENHFFSFFQAFVFLIYLPNRAIRAVIRPFCGCTMPGNRKPWIQREDLWCDCNAKHNSTKQPGQKPKFSSCQLLHLVFVSLNTSPAANRASPATRIRLNGSTATDQEHTQSYQVRSLHVHRRTTQCTLYETAGLLSAPRAWQCTRTCGNRNICHLLRKMWHN